MKRITGSVSLLLASMSLLAMVPGTHAENLCDDPAVKCCGTEYQLFISNDDVRPGADGKLHVAGDFFVQFQVVGANADAIEIFTFSVGLPPEMPENICDLPRWPTGLMLESYKADFDKTDGFFILQNTRGQSTPQGVDLTVAVHGYDGSGNELARFWAVAVVESCDGPGPGGCAEAEYTPRDVTKPWPVVLPFDGDASVLPLDQGITLDFPEPLSALKVELNGQDVTTNFTDWAGRPDWDGDTFWDYGYLGVFNTLAPMCTMPDPVHSCGPANGPAYIWNERPLTLDDVIRVEATDMNGNTVIKERHLGSSVAGGTIADGLPILVMTPEQNTIETTPGGTAVFTMKLENNGGGEGHPFADCEVPDGWECTWVPGHKPVPAGGSSQQELHIKVPLEQADGTYPAKAVVKYPQGSEEKTLQSPLSVVVAALAGGPTPTPVDDGADEEASPAIGPMLLLALAALAVAWRTRS